MSKVKAAARKRLATGGGCAYPSSMTDWFNEHHEAKIFVREWFLMRESGETNWTNAQVHEALVKEHDYPFSDIKHLATWCRRTFGGQHGKQ